MKQKKKKKALTGVNIYWYWILDNIWFFKDSFAPILLTSIAFIVNASYSNYVIYIIKIHVTVRATQIFESQMLISLQYMYYIYIIMHIMK